MATTHRGANLSSVWGYQRIYQGYLWLKEALFPSVSDDYLQWRKEFMHKRIGFGLWIGLISYLSRSIYNFYVYVIGIENVRAELDKYANAPQFAESFRDIIIIAFILTVGILLSCLWLNKTRFGKHYPAIIFLAFAYSCNGLLTQLIATFYQIPIKPNETVFLAFAVLLPLQWPLHFLAQLLPIIYYAVVFPLMGITKVGELSLFDRISGFDSLITFGWVCLVTNAGVYVYERLRRSEFESRRELQIFLHTISHDLRNPVMGSSMVVKQLLDKTVNGHTQVSAPILERLLQGSDRQLALINSLVEAYNADGVSMQLHFQPLQISTIAETVLADIEPKLIQNKIKLHNLIAADLPLVRADSTHLWRVLSNLIDNALKHNPPNIELTLSAEVIEGSWCGFTWPMTKPSQQLPLPRSSYKKTAASLNSTLMLLCCIQDNGIGIPHEQCQRLFELYTRGKRARYMPGLGLGLYLCRQIITAHGGEIGVISQPNKGSKFWFTLPLTASIEHP